MMPSSLTTNSAQRRWLILGLVAGVATGGALLLFRRTLARQVAE